MKNRNGKIDLSLIIGIFLLIAVIIACLEVAKVINIRALFGGQGTFIPINYEKKTKEMCSLVDEKGSYNQESADKKAEEIIELSNSKLIKELTEKNTEEAMDKLWDIIKDSNSCTNNTCVFASKDGDKVLYTYNCKKNKFGQENIDEKLAKLVTDYRLELGCVMINKNGVYDNSEESFKCSNYYCSTSYGGKTYRKNCKDPNKK